MPKSSKISAQFAGTARTGPDGARLDPSMGEDRRQGSRAAPAPQKSDRPVPSDYQEIVSSFRKRRVDLQLSQEDLNDAAGMTDGYVAKLESFARMASPAMLCLWAQSLGLRIAVLPDVLPNATRAAIANRATDPYDINKARFNDPPPGTSRRIASGPR